MFLEDLTYARWVAFLIILFRSGAVVAAMPVLGSQNVPPMLKVFISLMLAFVLWPVVELGDFKLPTTLLGFLPLMIGEILIGMILGLAARLLLASVQIMGQMAGFQMGFAVANVIDPMSGNQISILGQFAYLVAILTFLAVGGHHFFLRALADSFTLVPPGDFGLSQGLFERMMRLAGDMFTLAVRMGIPIIGALLFTSVIMGVLAKTVPQMNILIVGFPLKITVGLVMLSITFTVMVPVMAKAIGNLGNVFTALMKAM